MPSPNGVTGVNGVTGGAGFIRSQPLRHTWHAVAGAADLEAGPLARTVCGTPLVVFRDGEGLPGALPDRCSHRNAPLSLGTTVAGCLECPYHGWRYDADGRCREIPSLGPGAAVPPAAHLRPFRATAAYGLVWVCLDDPWFDLPACPWEDDHRYRRLNNPVERWEASATRMVDNFLDIAHFPWVHAGSFGAAAERQVPVFELESLPDGFTGYRYEVDAANSGASGASGQTADVVHRTMSTGFALPFTVRSTIGYDTGLDHILYLLTTPIDDVSSYFTFVVWRNDDASLAPEEVLALDHRIAAEDRWMLEKIEGPLPLGNDGVVSVRSDRTSVEWKRRLVDFLSGRPKSARPRPASGQPQAQS
jgi:phenylpropionate dioxygenase-like ring-hydroxylating dioxygenase large terminal subunit